MNRATDSDSPERRGIASRAEARAQISELDAQISDIELSLRSLRRKRDTVQKQLDSYIYPVMTLPSEIVAEIFARFLPVYPACPPMVGLLSPSTLCQVCRKWREIAVSTPSLWRVIYLDLDDERLNHTSQFQLLKVWLERSGACPLSISLDYSSTDMAILPIIALIFKHAFHWERMVLRLPFPYMDYFSSQEFPVLATLTLDPSEECPVWADPVVLFTQAPNLTNVTLCAYFDPFRIVLPWGQVTTLCGICLFEDELMEILRLAVNLTHCSVTLAKSARGDDMPIAPHMHLRDLTFTVVTPPTSTEMGIIAKLTLPALRNLQIPEPWLAPIPYATIAAWMERSGCDLEQLHITHASLSEFSYQAALPSVRKIIVDWDGLEPDYDDSDDDDSD
ncbi:hypothetical protein FB451DRAFT_1252650 [Mycena latifolia]|nr:hypothetical protein FB451DRAFT_1252650 [Mycena latifolia]